MALTFQDSENKEQSYYKSLEKNNSKLVIVSALDGHPMDGIPGKGSPFTNSLVRILLNNKQEIFSVSELIVELRKDIYDSTNQSSPLPSLGALRDSNHQGGEFCFKLKKEYVEKGLSRKASKRGKASTEDNVEQLIQSSLERMKIEFTKVVETNHDKLEDRMIRLENTKQKAKEKLNKKELLRLIKDDEIEKYFDTLDEVQEEIVDSQINDLINIQSQWRSVENQRRIGVISVENEFLSKNKLRKSIIEVTNAIERKR